MSGQDVQVAEVETPAHAPVSQKMTPGYRRLLIASSVGSAMEWYDFWCYALIGPLVFGPMFFPKENPLVGTIAVFATFAIGFLARPIGGIFFGHFGDRIGRRSILMITLLLMGIGTALIGCLPGYAVLGIWAPILLTSLRFIQGFALGGESMGALALVLENSPTKNRGFFASWMNAVGPAGIILAAGSTSLLTAVYGKAGFQGWAWRVPFIASIVLVAIGLYMRSHIDESFLFHAAQKDKKIPRLPIGVVLRKWKAATAAGFFINLVHSSYAYLSTVFIIAYAAKNLGMPAAALTAGMLIANVFKLFTVPLYAHLSDRIGRRPLMLAGMVVAALYLPVLFHLVALKSVFFFGLGIVISEALVHAMMWAPEAAFTAELFPTEVRVSGSSLAKQLGVVFGGGIAPLIATALMGHKTSFMPVNFYYWGVVVVSFIVILITPESRKRAL